MDGTQGLLFMEQIKNKNTKDARKIMDKIDSCEIKNPQRKELMFLLKLILRMTYIPTELKKEET